MKKKDKNKMALKIRNKKHEDRVIGWMDSVIPLFFQHPAFSKFSPEEKKFIENNMIRKNVFKTSFIQARVNEVLSAKYADVRSGD